MGGKSRLVAGPTSTRVPTGARAPSGSVACSPGPVPKNQKREVDAGLAADGNGLKLKMAAAEKCGCADELARGQVLDLEIRPIDTVKFVEEGEVGAGNLHIHQDVHSHIRLRQGGL